MTAADGSRPQLGKRGLESLRAELTGRDLAIISQVAELRLMSGQQIKAIHFSLADHGSEASAARTCQRVLNRLVQERLLVRLERRVGGARAGSESYVQAIGPVGQRVVTLGGPRRRFHEPTVRFLDHTLAITQVVVDVTVAARTGALEVLMCQPEPYCHRKYTAAHGRATLRPDLFLALGIGEYEKRLWIEIDQATESIPVVIRKCRDYEAYRQTGAEQAAHEVFGQVCWIVPHARRAMQIRAAIEKDRRLNNKLFVVVTSDQALGVLASNAVEGGDT